MKKKCSKCKKQKLLNDFHKQKDHKDGHCSACKVCQNKVNTKYRKSHPDYMPKYWKNNKEQLTKSGKTYRKNRRQIVIDAYGGKCVCKHKKGICGEDTFEFLSIQHKDGNGGKHRKEIGGSSRLCKWLIKNNFPKDNFELHCYNCNLSKGFYGYCPKGKYEKV